MNTIKKYNNRKMYFESRYITMSDIIIMLKNGQEVEVIAHGTDENVTNAVLKEALQLIEMSNSELINILKRG